MPRDDSGRRYPADGNDAPHNTHLPEASLTASTDAGTQRRRCAHLFPGLTGCRNQAEPASRYCADHQRAP